MAQQEYKMLGDKMFTYKGTVLTLENNHELTPEYIDSLEDFETKDDDVFVVTFPKSGNGTVNLILCSTLHHSLSFSDICLCCQVIYVMRNPKDVLVSYLHFSNNMKNLDSSESFDWMLENVFTGCMIGGCWFDHVKGWITDKDKYNILILTYEEMIKVSLIHRCENLFVGKNLSDAAIDKVVETATFKHMKKDPLANYESLSLNVTDRPKRFFFSEQRSDQSEKSRVQRMKDASGTSQNCMTEKM
uniref:Sulfotransferase n=1 Tax=Sinocyclocheilus grahami TaxID=75366 RepID=A0A672N204_SINGR